MSGDTGNLGQETGIRREQIEIVQHLIATSELAGDRLWLKKLGQVIRDCKINSQKRGWQCIRFPSTLNGDGESPALVSQLDCLKRKGKMKREGRGKIKALSLGFFPTSIH